MVRQDLEFKEKLIDLNIAITLKSNFAEAYINRASVKNNLSDYKGALIDYNKALELSPSVNIYNNRGTVKKSLNDYYGAIADYDIAIRLSPKNPAAYVNRGLAK